MYNGFSDNSTQDVVGLFRAMFSDSKIAERMQLVPNKLKYVVNHGIAPYVKDLLKSQVTSTDWFFVSFNKSLNNVTQKCELDICIRFWNKETC